MTYTQKERSKKYYLNHKEKLLQKQKDYYLKNKKRVLQYHREWYQKNKERIKQWHKEYRKKNQEKIQQYFFEFRKKALQIVGKLECSNCKSKNYKRLQINHINGDGGKETRYKTNQFYRNIINRKRQINDLNILCDECNMAYYFKLKYNDSFLFDCLKDRYKNDI